MEENPVVLLANIYTGGERKIFYFCYYSSCTLNNVQNYLYRWFGSLPTLPPLLYSIFPENITTLPKPVIVVPLRKPVVFVLLALHATVQEVREPTDYYFVKKDKL